MSDNSPKPVQLVALREQFELEHLIEHYDAHFWRPRIRTGEVRVGYVCTLSGENDPPTKEDLKGLSAAPLVVRIDNDLVPESVLFQKPKGWRRLFPKGTPGKGNLCVYSATPPSSDYYALSHVAIPYDPKKDLNPDPDFRCVHKALLGHSEFVSKPIWKDNESVWNVQGTAFFKWNENEEFPESNTPRALTTGTLLSSLQPESVKMTTPEEIAWEPVQFFSGNYNNSMNSQKYTATFEGIMTTATSVTGTWSREDSTAIESQFAVSVEFAVEATVGPVKITEKHKMDWGLAVKKSWTTAIGGGTTTLNSMTLRQNCIVDVPAGKDVYVTASHFCGRYPLTFTGILRFASETRGERPIEIPIKGTFDVSCDTTQTWWEVGDGTFVSKTTPKRDGLAQ